MSKVLIVYTSWYDEYINEMIKISSNIISDCDHEYETACAPGALELAALGKHHLIKNESSFYSGILFLGIVIRGETTHYDLVTNETFRSIGDLALNYPNTSVINNVLCVENTDQLIKRLKINTKNNTQALIELINEKSS
ncbi:6,7-dimethyl-8-ribityllumazine synthase [Gammaproteobacteria bacterium]|jgi:6,7-dimethyl-8-ribityllumazine synthase|nr:6,7-dimethyl-8-ribityllumazine synthase [Gammaproteobacteria bacterium]MDB4661784.1 6,7-dimethyl-8-ribityllumazine synthase [Gammaproteobacteria bacterium]MDC1150314.1 6,7-dimethyl-8-ribityllumazine synthase [Gammaproteobacteria bacterium]